MDGHQGLPRCPGPHLASPSACPRGPARRPFPGLLPSRLCGRGTEDPGPLPWFRGRFQPSDVLSQVPGGGTASSTGLGDGPHRGFAAKASFSVPSEPGGDDVKACPFEALGSTRPLLGVRPRCPVTGPGPAPHAAVPPPVVTASGSLVTCPRWNTWPSRNVVVSQRLVRSPLAVCTSAFIEEALSDSRGQRAPSCYGVCVTSTLSPRRRGRSSGVTPALCPRRRGRVSSSHHTVALSFPSL